MMTLDSINKNEEILRNAKELHETIAYFENVLKAKIDRDILIELLDEDDSSDYFSIRISKEDISAFSEILSLSIDLLKKRLSGIKLINDGE